MYLSQNKFPKIWNLFQYLFGGTVSKRKLCLRHYHGEKNILEVGCSVGNTSAAFLNIPDINFTGLDIDPVVIAYAQKKFYKYTNFTFLNKNLRDFSMESRCFDYILFPGVLHHIDRSMCIELINSALQILTSNGTLVIIDPILPKDDDNYIIKKFIRIEQGCYVRNSHGLLKILNGFNNLIIKEWEEVLIGATPFNFPLCARFGIYFLKKK